MFMTNGYKETSTRKIANKAGITQPNLYHYFPNKAFLYHSVISKKLEEIGDSLYICLMRGENSDFENTFYQMILILLESKKLNHATLYTDINLLPEDLRDELANRWKKMMLNPFEDLFKRSDFIAKTNLTNQEINKIMINQLFGFMKAYQSMDNEKIASLFVKIFLHGI